MLFPLLKITANWHLLCVFFRCSLTISAFAIFLTNWRDVITFFFSYLQEDINLKTESEKPTEDPTINFVKAIDEKEGKIEVFIVEENLG